VGLIPDLANQRL